MDSFSDHVHDPLLFLNADKNDLDAFLMNTSADMAHMAEEMHVNVSDVKLENSLDLDSLEGGGHLGDMNWLHNSSLSTLAHLDSDDTSDSTNLISVNPQSVLPVQVVQNENARRSSDGANSAVMHLHGNYSNFLESRDTETYSMQQQIKESTSQSILTQEHPSIRILSVVHANPFSSPTKTPNVLFTSTRDLPHKAQTFVLSTVDGSFPAGLTISSADLPIHNMATGSHFVLASPQKIHAVKTNKTGGQVVLKPGNSLLSPSQASPILLGRLQTGVPTQVFQQVSLASTIPFSTATAQMDHSESATVSSTTNTEEKVYPKPVFSYSCLIALALKNSKNGSLPVSEIYSFMCENFPYFKTAPDGWKNSVRHNLSLNKCFAKVENPRLTQGAKKGCLWALNPAKVLKMEDEISKWGKKDPVGLLNSMAYPENLDAIEKGQAGLHYSKKKSPDCTPCTPLRAETTSSTPEFAPEQKPDISQIKIEKYHPNIPVEQTEFNSLIKVEYCDMDYRDNSPILKQELPSTSPKSHSSFKMDSTDFSCTEIPVSFTTDALTDIVLQNSVWDDDLENNIDIDLICDSPSSHLASPSAQSPVMFRSSPNPASHPHR